MTASDHQLPRNHYPRAFNPKTAKSDTLASWKNAVSSSCSLLAFLHWPSGLRWTLLLYSYSILRLTIEARIDYFILTKLRHIWGFIYASAPFIFGSFFTTDGRTC